MDGASIRATRVMPTVPDASAMAAARVATGIVGGITAIGIATATVVAVTKHLQSAANVLLSALVIATVSSASPPIGAITPTAKSPRRLVRIQLAK